MTENSFLWDILTLIKLNPTFVDQMADPEVRRAHLKTSYTTLEQLKQMLAGGIAAAMTRCLSQPMDVLKIRFQLQVEPIDINVGAKSKYSSVPQAVRVIVRDEGVHALWKGHNPAQVLSVIYGISQFWAFEQLTLQARRSPLLQERPNLSNFVCGGMAGIVAAVMAMPPDVIRTRLIAQDNAKGYRCASRAVVAIVRTEGVRALYRGVLPAVCQMAPLQGTNFMLYQFLTKYAIKTLQIEDRSKAPTSLLLSLGGISGVVSKTIVYPLDLIKRRMQIQGFEKNRQTFGQNIKCSGILNCLRLTVQREGVRGLYKGMTPSLIKSGLTTALHFGIYDKISNLIRNLF